MANGCTDTVLDLVAGCVGSLSVGALARPGP